MSIWSKVKLGLQNWMQGRYGADKLGNWLVYGSLGIMLVNVFLNWFVLTLLYTALLVWGIFRMFSRNLSARYNENLAFERLRGRVGLVTRQTATRLKNTSKYKYYACPKCKARLKLPRGVGEVTVTCGKCGEKFKKKA